MMSDVEIPSPEQRLYGAATRWQAGAWRVGPEGVVDAAVEALLDGLDSPGLRMLAGAPPSARDDEIRPLLEAALEELGIPRPGSFPPWTWIGAGGRTVSRPPTDTVRFDIATAPADVGGFELRVHVNDVEMTSRGAGMGMDPFAVLVPVNRLVALPAPHVVPIARCACGVHGCGSTDVTIVRDGDAVHWEWLLDVPADHGCTFPAADYDAEVARIHADHSWERPGDAVARAVLERVDRDALRAHGLTVSWAAVHDRDGRLVLALLTDDGAEAGHQVFLRFPWQGRRPDDVADEVARTLARRPRTWPATFQPLRPGVRTPPAMAGRRWRRETR